MKKERSILITDIGLKALRRNPLTKVEGIVLWYLIEYLPLGGDEVSHVALGRALAVAPVNLSGIMKRLCEIGFLIRAPREYINHHYKLNPIFFRIM